MVTFWPSETPPASAYGANKIASRAFDVIVQSPTTTGMDAVFASAVDLVSRGLTTGLEPKVGQAAVALWPNSFGAVAELSTHIATHLSDADLVNILTTPGNSVEQVAAKRDLALVVARDAKRTSSIANGLLDVPPFEIGGQPDGALGLWLGGLGDSHNDTIEQLLNDKLNDEQAARVAGYIFGAATRVGLPFLLESLPVLLRPEAFPTAVEWITSHFEMLSELTAKRGDKSAMVAVLIDCLPRLSGEPLARTAEQIDALGGKGALEKRNDILDALDSRQVLVVAAQIPSSVTLAKRAERVE
jgi:hypothetical protein